jgi:hypothetical protein
MSDLCLTDSKCSNSKKSDALVRARVNLPHIRFRKCIKFVLNRNLLKMQRSTFLSRDLNQNFELDATKVTKIGIIFVIR